MDGTAISKLDNRYRKSADVSNIIKVQTHEFTVQNLQEMPSHQCDQDKNFSYKSSPKSYRRFGLFYLKNARATLGTF